MVQTYIENTLLKIMYGRVKNGIVFVENHTVQCKKKTMIVSQVTPRFLNIIVNGVVEEHVNKFKYLGVWITEEGRCEMELKIQIAMAKHAYNRRHDILKRIMSLTMKIIVKAVRDVDMEKIES